VSGAVVAAVEPGSIAQALGIRQGNVLLEINGHPLRDVLDVQFYAADEELDLLVRRGQEELCLHAVRGYNVPLGLDFTAPTFDGLRRCDNRCDFCFVAQMPPGLRRSLYIRDDDYRYSVLYGSFITLTRLSPEDWERLEEQRLSPLYVSVHATEPGLRRQLLGRADIPDILSQIDRLAALGIEVHAQIVLVPGVNDGPHLARSIADLSARYPAVCSIGVVPVGLTRYHRGRCSLYTSAQAEAIIDQVTPLQAAFRRQHGLSLVYLADEWYLLSGREVPPAETYDEYPQIENGIGLVRQFLDDSRQLAADLARPGPLSPRVGSCTLACGTLIAPVLQRAARDLAARSGVRIEVVPVANRLFGETVTVSGLLAGEDVAAALRGRDLGEIVFLPGAMFAEPHFEDARPPQDTVRDEARERTLDDLTVQDLEKCLGCPVVATNWMSQVWDELRRGDRS
jgi:putative radical SAM enzyme (TIGR03279 family)